MMVIFKERAELSHFHEVDLLLLDLALKAEAVLEGAELLDKLHSLLVVLSHAGGNLALFWMGERVHRSISWSNSSTVRRS